MELRPYQKEAVAAVENRLSADGATLIVLATGCGKTIVFSHLAAREVQRGGRVLILAHRGELLEQAIDKLRKSTGIIAGMEKADVTADADADGDEYPVVVGSVQSMCRPKRLARFNPAEFSLIIIDECHHALTDTYTAILKHFVTARVLGVTATPDRGDQRSLGKVFHDVAYEYNIVQAIRDGYLSPIVAQTVPLKIDLSAVAKQAGDYQASSLGNALDPYLRRICDEIKVRCASRKTIVFTPLIATSKKMMEFLNAAGVCDVREVNGESADREATLKWFETAKPGCVLLNSMLLTEGYDEPSVDCIVVLRATQVRSLYVQMVGRGTRLHPGKKNLLLLDFLWMTARHDLCRPSAILTDDPDVCKLITKKQEKKTGSDDEMEISPDVLDSAVSETVRKREDSLAKKLEAQRQKKGGLVDPLMYAKNIGSTSLAESMPGQLVESDRPTMEQFDRLEKLGFACPGSASAANALLEAYEHRSSLGLSAPKQIRFLRSKGFVGVENWTKSQAEKMINRIAVNGWRIPRGIDPNTYTP